LLGPGSYLAGFVFEKSGKPEDALRYYDEALAYGQYQSLVEPIRRLSQQAGYSSPRFRELLSQAPAPAPNGADPAEDAELLVMVNFGRVPAKIAKRVPIGLALTYASGFISPTDAARANQLALQGLVTWVNYPELGKPRSSYGRPTFMVDGQWQRLEAMLAVDQEAKAAWEKARGAIVASAITRTITRVVAGAATKEVAGGGALGTLLSLGAQVTMTAVDTPDTRNWSTLPARIAFGRVRIKSGPHKVVLTAPGGKKDQSVNIPAGGWGVVCLTALN